MPDDPKQAELDFVQRLARAFAVANGHSHPDEYAASVVDAYVGTDEAPADAPQE